MTKLLHRWRSAALALGLIAGDAAAVWSQDALAQELSASTGSMVPLPIIQLRANASEFNFFNEAAWKTGVYGVFWGIDYPKLAQLKLRSLFFAGYAGTGGSDRIQRLGMVGNNATDIEHLDGSFAGGSMRLEYELGGGFVLDAGIQGDIGDQPALSWLALNYGLTWELGTNPLMPQDGLFVHAWGETSTIQNSLSYKVGLDLNGYLPLMVDNAVLHGSLGGVLGISPLQAMAGVVIDGTSFASCDAHYLFDDGSRLEVGDAAWQARLGLRLKTLRLDNDPLIPAGFCQESGVFLMVEPFAFIAVLHLPDAFSSPAWGLGCNLGFVKIFGHYSNRPSLFSFGMDFSRLGRGGCFL